MFLNQFKLIWRRIIKDRRFTVLNLIGLSTGLASAIMIYLWVSDEISVDSYHKKNDQLYKAMYNIQTSNGILTLGFTPYPLAGALVAEMPEVEAAVSVNPFMDWFEGPGIASNGKNSIKSKGIFAGKDYFNVFSVPLISGNVASVLTEKSGVVISESLAKKLYSTAESSIGQTLEWEHKMKWSSPLHVAGVYKDLPPNSTQQFDIIFNFDLLLEAESNASSWRGTYAETYFILKKGTDLKLFENKIRDISKRKEITNDKCTVEIQQYSRQYLHGRFENGKEAGGRIQYVKLFSAIALFILVIACINFMNLSTAQATAKIKEVGIKKTIGASRKSLAFQFIGESVILSLLSLIVAILLINILMPYFNILTGKNLQINTELQFTIPVLLITLITGFISGSYPAFYLSGFNPIGVLKGQLTARGSELNIRKLLVVVQFTISVVFIVGVLTIKSQLNLIQTKNLGYNRSNVLQFNRESKFKGDPELFLSELKTIPGVLNASGMSGSIFDGTDGQSGFSWRGQKADEAYLFKSPRISYDLIETLDMKLVEGRTFSRDFKDDDSKIVLNESAVKMMALKNPVGKTIKNGSRDLEIIGIVGDFQYGSMHQAIEPLIFRFRDARISNNIIVSVKPGTETSTIRQIESVYKKHITSYPFEFRFLDESYQRLYESEQRIAGLSGYFAGLAIIISCLGLFGLVAFTAQRRQKEMSIRKIVGATALNIMILLSRDFLKLILVAILIAIPVSWIAMHRWLENFAYKVNISAFIFIAAGSAILLIAVITVCMQAIRSALSNPVKSLRSE